MGSRREKSGQQTFRERLLALTTSHGDLWRHMRAACCVFSSCTFGTLKQPQQTQSRPHKPRLLCSNLSITCQDFFSPCETSPSPAERSAPLSPSPPPHLQPHLLAWGTEEEEEEEELVKQMEEEEEEEEG
eukprot:746232-Hanusia_phi.AAC.1